MESVVARASSGDSGKKFATKEANFSTLQSVYSLAQCTPDLSASDCSYCLSESIGDLRGPSFNFSYQGGQRLLPSCIVRYDIYQFYGTSTTARTALLPPLLPPPVLPTRSPPPVLPTRSPPPVLSPPHPPTSSPGKTPNETYMFFTKACFQVLTLKLWNCTVFLSSTIIRCTIN